MNSNLCFNPIETPLNGVFNFNAPLPFSQLP